VRRRARPWLALVLAGCGAGSAAQVPDAGGSGDANPGSDAAPTCTTNVTFAPAAPVAGDQVVATGTVDNGPGISDFAWQVMFGGAIVPSPPIDQFGSTVQFLADQAGPYQIHFQAGAFASCLAWDGTLNVGAPGANRVPWRVRIAPAGDLAPPQEQILQVPGGADFTAGPILIQPGLVVDGHVVDGAGAPLAAALRFEPDATPDLPIEAAAVGGSFHVRVQSGPHHVLIIPTDPTHAPVRLAGWQGFTSELAVPGADAISGTVRAPDNSPVVGARVELTIAGTPTTIATTDAAGAWSVLGHRGGTVAISVVPPAAGGLPRLDVRDATLDLTQPVAVRYAPSLATIDLAGTTILSGIAVAPGARVTFVGTIASAGTVTAGLAAPAAGRIQQTAIADGAGVLPSVRVPAVAQRAVIAPTPAVFAVIDVDAASPPATLTAPAPITLTGTVTVPGGGALPGAHVQLAPIGDLATATLIPAGAIADATGQFSIQVAPGGHYGLVASDPTLAHARAAMPDVTGGAFIAVPLGAALVVNGSVQLAAQPSGLVGAGLTLLCATCTGVERSRAVAEGVTGTSGYFQMAVPDPGVTPAVR
jgi:hypothetical protein